MTRDILLLFPGALGDFVCLWPTLQTLRRENDGRVALVTKPEFFPLLPNGRFIPISIDRREIADLFARVTLHPATRRLFAGFERVHSWTGHGDPNFANRLRAATEGIVSVHQFRASHRGEHAGEYYARCVDVRPFQTRFSTPTEAMRWAADFWTAHHLGDRALVIHAGSGSPRKNWEGMAAVATWWQRTRGEVAMLVGPAEAERPGPHVQIAVRSESLDRVGALLRRAHLYLGNDSGISHLAGLVGARGVALFGPTDPTAWRPLGNTVRVLSVPTPCPTCGPNHFCVHRLPVERVCAELTLAEAVRAELVRAEKWRPRQ
jgi:ADP-heptose:LPS heptosyltransferase